jgi:hypothetical protein
VPLAALAALAFSATRWRRRRPASAQSVAAGPGDTTGPALDPDDSARLDADLERYKL